ncbi:hypothetical protein Y032_0230g2978 [Ancylostoma ceylanicum]|uniref:Peptidase S1 domain-containing protein n=1 Tax=Ancylostoma ceylanicum TaxID=53326 RepID=A0A016SGT8_9BILA|nr:hypothetical protein Y032_0230g2978 [Ancylostoma ceylanicum]
MPRFLLVLLHFAFLLVNSWKLTTEENEQNRQQCGVHFLGDGERNELFKNSCGRRGLKENEYPWTVRVVKDSAGACSGALISQRHVLTAAHCMLKMNGTYNSLQCDANKTYGAISVMRSPDEVSIHFRGNLTKCGDSDCFQTETKAGKITLHNFEFCASRNDLALIELSENISEVIATPICLPNEDLQLVDGLYAAGYGVDENGRALAQVVAQKYYGVDEPSHKIVTRTFGRAIPSDGDGGPLFRTVDNGTHTLVGINSNGETRCPKADVGENFEAEYVDVRAYLDWICKYSGVCPIEDSGDESPSDASNSTQEATQKRL